MTDISHDLRTPLTAICGYLETSRNSTGLGLSIAKLLTERMGGRIEAAYRESRLLILLTFPPE